MCARNPRSVSFHYISFIHPAHAQSILSRLASNRVVRVTMCDTAQRSLPSVSRPPRCENPHMQSHELRDDDVVSFTHTTSSFGDGRPGLSRMVRRLSEFLHRLFAAIRHPSLYPNPASAQTLLFIEPHQNHCRVQLVFEYTSYRDVAHFQKRFYR